MDEASSSNLDRSIILMTIADPKEIKALIGKPGEEQVLKLAELFSKKKVLNQDDFEEISYQELEQLSWYYIIDLKRRGEKFKVKKGEMFRKVLELIKNERK